jgi:hypothetical protein
MGVVNAVQSDADDPLDLCGFILFQRLSVCLERMPNAYMACRCGTPYQACRAKTGNEITRHCGGRVVSLRCTNRIHEN